VLGVILVLIFLCHCTGSRHRLHAVPHRPGANIHDMILPSITLAVGSLAVYCGLRAEMIATLQRTTSPCVAKASDVANPDRHALRPSTIALVTVAASTSCPHRRGVLVEYIFALPGVGVLAIESIFSKDYWSSRASWW